MYFFEHVLMRLEKSEYRDNIILKGGVLLSSIIGSDMRTTKDLDATLKSIPLNEESIRNIFEEILSIDIGDGIIFEIENIKDIRLETEYGGYRINVYAKFDKLKTNFFIEITTGDIITPSEIEYKYNSIFEDKTINIMAYNIETIIAEKFESIISKNITTTRAKDYYDIYVLVNNHIDEIEKSKLIKAIKRTFEHRNTNYDIEYLNEIFEIIRDNIILKELFENYSKKLIYAKNVKFEETIQAINEIINILKNE
jgi:predicted nucleotidyltransferase component of viral defense system